jgi:hypothetical protein
LCLTIDSPASSEIRLLIRFLHAKIIHAEENHRELCAAVYGQNAMSEKLQDSGIGCSKMGQQMFTMKNKVVGHL